MEMGILLTCKSVHHMHARCLSRSEEDFRSSRIGVTEGCELPCGCWEQIKPVSSGRAARALNHWPISPAQ